MALAFLFLFLSCIIVGVMLAYGKRRQKYLLEVQELKHTFQQSLLSSQIEIQEETLKNISQELHDNISQQLGLIKIQLTGFQDKAPELQVSRQLISSTIEDIRAMSKSLHPDRIASISLQENIHQELERLQKISSLNIQHKLEEDQPELKIETRIIVFRIFQELLNNVLKHSQAKTLEINLSYKSKNLLLQVSDDGIGIPQNISEGIGFTSIRNRLGLLKGSLHFSDFNQKGTCVQVIVPFK
jgi:signal transduction histidine kinase